MTLRVLEEVDFGGPCAVCRQENEIVVLIGGDKRRAMCRRCACRLNSLAGRLPDRAYRRQIGRFVLLVKGDTATVLCEFGWLGYSWRCRDCRCSCPPMFMVGDWRWLWVSRGRARISLCVQCYESRTGRRLRVSDLKKHPDGSPIASREVLRAIQGVVA